MWCFRKKEEQIENWPYSKKPVFLVLVRYVLACIGKLPEEEEEVVCKWIQRAFGGNKNWKRTLRLRFNFAETSDEGFREMWFQNERPENALCAFVDPLVFAEALIGITFWMLFMVSSKKTSCCSESVLVTRLSSLSKNPERLRVCVYNETYPKEAISMGAHSDEVTSAAFSPNCEHLVSGSIDRTIKLWETASGKEIASWDNELFEYSKPYPVYSVTFSSSGRSVISGGDDYAVKIWDIQKGSLSRILKEHYCATAVDITRDGRFVVSGGSDCMNMDCVIKLWDVQSGNELKQLKGHSNAVTAIAFSPGSRWIVSGGTDATLRLWEVSSGKMIRSNKAGSVVNAVSFSPDEKFVAAGNNSSEIRIWETETGNDVIKIAANGRSIRSICFSADGKYLVSGDWNGSIKIWETSTGKEVAHHQQKTPIIACQFSPDGKRVWAADNSPKPNIFNFPVPG